MGDEKSTHLCGSINLVQINRLLREENAERKGSSECCCSECPMVGQNWLVPPDIRSRYCDATRTDRYGIREPCTPHRPVAFLAAGLS